MSAEVQKYTREQIETLELAPGFEHEALEGSVPVLATDEDLKNALEKAFDFRGDVTITLKSGEKIEAYIFNRSTGATLAESWVQYFTPKSEEKRKLPTIRSRIWSSAKIAPPESTGKTGSRPTTKRRPPAKRTSAWFQIRWNSRRLEPKCANRLKTSSRRERWKSAQGAVLGKPRI